MDLPEKIKMFEGSCNTYLIDDDVKVLVDAGYDYDGKVDIILLTHAHPNHIKHLKEIMARNPECEVFLDVKEVSSLAKEGIQVNERFKGLYEGKTKISTGTYTFEVIEVPAHSKGSVAFYDSRAGILFTGDTLLKKGPGSTSMPDSIPDFMDTAVSLLLGLDFKVALPGHGEIFTPEEFEG